MNRKKDKGWESPRPFKVTHQVLVISNVNFQKRSVSGHVEMSVVPTAAAGLTRIRLNCKQCRIHRVCVDEQKAEFSYTDPTLEVCRHQAQQRNLSSFAAAYAAAVSTVDPDDGTGGRGELDITVPAAVTAAASGLGKQDDPKASLKVRVDFHLDQPKGGLHFVVPDTEGSMADRAAHMFSTGRQARLWFPCVDSCSELCTWRLEFTVDAAMTAVSCGDLLETVYTQDMSRKTFHYALGMPTAAPSIALAVGPFQVLADPYVRQVTHFCLPRLLPLLRHSVSFLHDALDFYEEVLTCRYPYGCFKTVFVDEAYAQVSSYASLGVLSTNLLHGAAVIDQSPATRRCLAQALARQYFGCFLSRASWADDWVLEGISGYVYGLYLKKTFGVNEYRHWVKEELDLLVEYELKTGGVLLHPTSGGGKKRSSPTPPSHLHLSVKRPQMLSWEYGKMFRRKAHLVMRLIESHIGVKFTLQVINKLLSLAASAATQKQQAHQAWSQMLVSTHGFLKLISDVSSKDVGPLIKQWVEQSGVVKLHGSFSFNRKRNVLELEIRQDGVSPGTQLYAGPVRVTVQELDGSFNHTLQLEGNSGDPKHDIPCHSKSRRNKKKKIPLLNGEEVDMDLAAMDADSPLLWVRVDPDMSLLRRVELEQADFMWQYQLRFERDAVAQEEAAAALQRFPTPASRLALTDVLENEQCFYRVRLLACHRLAGIANAMVRTRQQQQQPGPPTLKSLFAAMFCSKRCPDIVRTNDFGDFQSYFLQRAMPVAMASLRDARKLCPRDVVRFVVDLIKYNDNSRNAFSDSYYRADLVEALSGSLTPALAGDGSARTAGELSADVRLVLEEISRFLNMEKRLPSFRNTVTVSCLRAVRHLQRSGHLPSDPSLFVSYAAYGLFVDVRVAALEALVDYTRAEGSAAELWRLLDVAQNDPVHYIRHKILSMLAQNPPFLAAADKAASVPSPLCDEALVERLWTLMNSGTSHDWRLRCDAVTLYHALFGLARPSCLPEPEPEPVQFRPKEKKAALEPEQQGVDDTVTHTPPGGTDAHSSGTAGHPTADEESERTSVGVGGVRQTPAPPPSPQDLERKEEEETPPLVHPMELRRRGSRQRGEGKGRGGGRYRVRFTDMERKEDIVVETGGRALHQNSDSGDDDSDHLDPPERPPTPGEGPASPVEQPALSAHVPTVYKETTSSSPPKHALGERSRRHRERKRKRKEKGEKTKDKTPELTHESKDKDTEGDRVREKRKSKNESKEESETHAVKEKHVHEGEKKDRDRHKEKDKLLSKEKEAQRDTAKKEKVRHEEKDKHESKEKDTEGDHVKEKHKHESKEETETYSVKEKHTHEKKDKDRHQEKDKHESKEKATERDTTKKEKRERTHGGKNESKEDSETHAVKKDKHERKRERDGDRRKDTDTREVTEDGEMQTVKKDKKEERRDRDTDKRKRKRQSEEDSDVYAVRKKARHMRDKEDGDERKEKDRHTRESKNERDRDRDKAKREAEEDGETRAAKMDKQQHRHDGKKDRDKHPQEGKKAKDEGGRTDKRKRKHEGQEDDDIHTARKKKHKRERQEEDRDVYKKKEKHKHRKKEDRDMDRCKKKHKHEKERKEMGDIDRDRRREKDKHVHESKEDDEAYAVRRKKRKHKRDMKEKDRERDTHQEKRRHKHDGNDKEDKDTSTKERHRHKKHESKDKHKKHDKDKHKDKERHKTEKHRENKSKHKHKKDRERRHRTSHAHSSSQAGGISLHSTVPV